MDIAQANTMQSFNCSPVGGDGGVCVCVCVCVGVFVMLKRNKFEVSKLSCL